jgi:transposase InsO family protein
VERFNRTVRYEWLAQYLFDNLDEVQRFATHWLWTYNHERPNMALGAYSGEAGPPFRFMAGQYSGPCRAGVKR